MNKNRGTLPMIAMILCLVAASTLCAKGDCLVRLKITEPAGLDREHEYVTIQIQTDIDHASGLFLLKDNSSGDTLPVQVFDVIKTGKDGINLISFIFPVSVKARQSKSFSLLKETGQTASEVSTDLSLRGEGVDLIIENEFYRANLTSGRTEEKAYSSGQIRELNIKFARDLRLFRTENRIHWAPNFKNRKVRYYKTIAHWITPRNYDVFQGCYLIQTRRQDLAPQHPEILLTATYQFLAKKPYFLFHSTMRFVEDSWIELLRNDEMTMDSIFTHVAFQRNIGEIVFMPFSERYEFLKRKPIDNRTPWLCFYHVEKKYAFGSIRIYYENVDDFGNSAPVYNPHTKISDGAGGGKYWNRRLIDDKSIFVPKGNRYSESNAYLVFRIRQDKPFAEIIYWSKRLRQPLTVEITGC